MTAITFDVLARDHASSINKKIGDSFESLEKRVKHSAREMIAAIGVGFGAEKIIEFGRAAVDAFEKTQAGERRLEDAFDRFPKLADTNITALHKLNDAIENRTGFLARDLAAGEANLAQFNLTGEQLTKITPLLVDYADKTGQDIPEAATLLGRALLGNQRALKAIGISMPAVGKSAADVAKAQRDARASTTELANAQEHLSIMVAELRDKRRVTAADELRYKQAQEAVRTAYAKNQTALANLRTEQDKTARSGSYFDQVVTGLRGKVGGFADKESQSAQGETRKLRAEFDKVEVKIGAQLLPKLLDLGHFLTGTLIPDLESVGGWLQHNSDVIVPLVKVVGSLTLAVYATNTAHKLWASASQAAASWTKLLGSAAGTAAPEVAAEGGAASTAAAGNIELAGSARSATAAIEAEGGAAAVASGRVAGLLANLAKVGPAAAVLLGLANFESNPKSLGFPFGFNNDLGPGRPHKGQSIRLPDGKTAKITGVSEIYLDSAGNRYSDPGLTRRIGGPVASGGSTYSAGLSALLGKGLPAPKEGSDLPARGTANRVLAATLNTERTTSRTSKKVKDILAGLPQFAVGSGYGVAEGIAKGIKAREQKALAAAKSLASKLKSQIDAIDSTLTSFKDTVAGSILDNANLLNTGNQTVEGLVRFEKHQLSIDQTFHRNLAKLHKLGFSAAYISELAQAGPQQAGNIAAQLVTSTVNQRNELNRTARAIASTAHATADEAAKAVFPKMYDELRKQTIELKAVKTEIAHITSDLETLARTGHLQTRVGR